MDEIIKSDATDIVSFFKGNDGKISIPRPFERDIFLFDCHIAGTSHIDSIKEITELLHEDDRLEFFREPDNPHDKRAIVIKNADGIKVGYVPRRDNIVFSRLMDAGKLLFGRVKSKEMINGWMKIKIQIFLHE